MNSNFGKLMAKINSAVIQLEQTKQ